MTKLAMLNDDPAAKDQSSEQAFWSILINRISAKTGNAPTNSIIMAGRGINCYLGDAALGDSNMSLFEIADTVPEWGMSYSGGKTGDFYGTYQAWVQQLHPPVGDAAAEAQLKVIRKKITDYDSGTAAIKLANYHNFIADNCLQPSSDGSACSAWLPGASIAQWQAEWISYMTSDDYKAQTAQLTTEAGDTMDGLQAQFNALAQKAYGAGYRTLSEAQSAADYADTSVLDRTAEQKELAKKAQMMTTQDGVSIDVPRYTSNPNQADFTTWLSKAKTNFANGVAPALQFQITTSDHETNTTSYQFSGGVSFPICDIFMASGSTSGSGTTVKIDNYDFTCELAYQDLVFVACEPSTIWYNGAMLDLYSKFTDFPKGSQFLTPPAKVCPPFSKDGALPLRVVGFYVAYRQSVKLSMTNFNQFKEDTKWTEKSSCSLFGLFNIGSESVSHQHSRLDVKTYADGFSYTDASDIPKVIALRVEVLGQAPLAFG